MTTVTIDLSMSLDGFVTGPDDSRQRLLGTDGQPWQPCRRHAPAACRRTARPPAAALTGGYLRSGSLPASSSALLAVVALVAQPTRNDTSELVLEPAYAEVG